MIAPLILLLLLLASPVFAQGPGLFIAAPGTGRSVCTAITSPVTNQTWCADGNNSPNYTWKVWDGTQYVSIGGSSGVVGSGTTNTIPLWTNGPGGIIGDSILSQSSGTVITVGAGAFLTQFIKAGNAGADGASLIVGGGDGGGGNATGGVGVLTGGTATGSGDGGGSRIVGGAATSGTAGFAQVTGGTASTGTGGFVAITGGTSTLGTGGDVFISYGPGAVNGNVIINGLKYPAVDGTVGQVIRTDGAGTLTFGSAGSGTVTSVDLTMPGIFGVAGGPITTSGTFAVSLSTQSANTVWAGPTGGGPATPTFRALVTADLPAGTGTVTGSGAANQIAVWSSASAITGFTDFTWDDANSIFVSGSNTVTGTDARWVLGVSNTDDGNTTFTIGTGNTNHGTSSLVLGLTNTLTATSSLVFGSNNTIGSGECDSCVVLGRGMNFTGLTESNVVVLGVNAGAAFAVKGNFLYGGASVSDALTDPDFQASGGTLTLGKAGGGAGVLSLVGSTSGTVSIGAAAAAGSTTFLLPIADGSNGDCLVTDGAGQLAFSNTCAGGGGITSLNGLSAAVQTVSAGSTNINWSSAVATHTFTWTGQLSALRGGTGIDTSGSTGVPTISAGTWSVAAQLSALRGGTGIDTSGSTGVPSIAAGTWSVNAQLPLTLGGTGADLSVGPCSNCFVMTNGGGTALTTVAPPLPATRGGTGFSSFAFTGAVLFADSASTLALSNTLTNHAMMVGGGAGAAPKTLAALTNGQLYIGSTGTDPSPATLTAGSGISIANGAGSIIISATGSGGNVSAGGTLTANQIVIGQGSTNVATLGTLGTTSTVLHGNAAGAPFFAAVDLVNDITGILGVTHGGTGLASGTTGGVLYHSGATTIASSTQLTNTRIILGGGPAGPRPMPKLQDGQLPIGSTAGDPVNAFLTCTGAVTCTPGPGTITINATAIAPAGITGSVQFNTAGVLNGDGATFFWDNTNKRLGLGTSSPTTQLTMTGDLTATGLTWAQSANRQIVTENASTCASPSTCADYRTYQRYVLNDLNNAQKSGIYIENVNSQGTLSVSSLIRAGATVTATTTTAHNFQSGYLVIIAGASPSDYNGEFSITVTGGTTFTYPIGTTPGAASGTITAQQNRTNPGIAIFHASQRDNGHEVSGIVSTEWGEGNAGTFQKFITSGKTIGFTPVASRQFGFALETTCDDNQTCALFRNNNNGVTLGLATGVTAGPPWAEGLRIFPGTSSNLDSTVGIRVVDTPNNLSSTTGDRFRVTMDGRTYINDPSGSSDQLRIDGTGANGANIEMIGNGATTPRKFIRTNSGNFEVLNDGYSQALLRLSEGYGDTGTALLLQRNIGGVFTVQQVTQGAADSCGLGFRCLRVPN